MKIKSILALGLLSLGLTSLVNAQTTNYVYITGSTAFRPAAFTSMYNQFSPAPVVSAWKAATATDPTGAAEQQITGTIGGANYVITCLWSGSEAGITDITGNGTRAFMAPGATPATNTLSAGYTGSRTNHVVDLAFADNSQAFSKTTTPTATGVRIGIIPFVFLKNAQTNAPSDWLALTNVTDVAFRSCLKQGGLKAAQFTGNPADTNRYVYISGRDNNSGTRVNTFADTGYGIKSSANQVNISGSDLAPTLAATTSGQSSGGTLVSTMGFRGSATAFDSINGTVGVTNGWYAIAYAGMYDADVALSNGCVQLTFNGVDENTTTLTEGNYSFWGYEFLYQSINNLSSGGSTLYTLLTQSNAAAITAACDGTHTIALGAMKCSRLNNNPTADPVHN
ncbi:MAG: hypothetical protein WCK57_02000 [Verrucomicrobiae bacterium]